MNIEEIMAENIGAILDRAEQVLQDAIDVSHLDYENLMQEVSHVSSIL